MPRLDRFVDPLHRGVDYMKHRMEDAYDAMPGQHYQQRPSGFMSWLTGKSHEEPYAQKLGNKVVEAFQRGRHAMDYGDYGRHRGFGYEDEGFLSKLTHSFEDSIFNSTKINSCRHWIPRT